MENRQLPLNDFHVERTDLIINRLHMLIHGIALLALFHYRLTTLHDIYNSDTKTTHLLAHLLIFISELTFSFLWLLSQASKWRPITRKAYPERLPEDEKLPPIDVFICTADPNKEPSIGVMNTVISALALDYPPDKLHVYLSDDGGSLITLRAVREAWKFAKWWIPFSRKYGLKNRAPDAYFSGHESCGNKFNWSNEFALDQKKIEKRYEEFKDCVTKIVAGTNVTLSGDHSSTIEVITDEEEVKIDSEKQDMPLLVYVAREKRPTHPHHFKAGALNVLLRVSTMISNSPYILVLDCDMYCHDSSSARQAMCFHLDTQLSPTLAFVQFPQVFHNISDDDIYDGQLRFLWLKWKGMDGLRGPVLSGTCFYIKRKALYGTHNIQQAELIQLQKSFGSSNEFIKSLYITYKPYYMRDIQFHDSVMQDELHLQASCSYDNGTKWGKEVGFRYFAVVEDYFTSFNIHCEGWISVYYEPKIPGFLGATPTSLNEVLIQHTRWFFGLMQIGLSRFSPLLYGPLRMSILQSMCYAEMAYYSLYFMAIYCLAVVPQLCLIRDIALYPQITSPFSLVFMFVFISSQLKHVLEVLQTRHPMNVWANEQRIWVIKSATSYLYASLNAIIEKLGLTKAKFLPTNKVVDDEQDKLYRLGIYNFQVSPLYMVPICTLYLLSVTSFIIGIWRILVIRNGNAIFIQASISTFAIVLFLPLFQAMALRNDKDFWTMAGMSIAEVARAKMAARREREAAQRASRAIPPNLGDGSRDLTREVDPEVGIPASAGGGVEVPPCTEAHEGERTELPPRVVMVEPESEEIPAEGAALADKKRKGPAVPSPAAKKVKAPVKPGRALVK